MFEGVSCSVIGSTSSPPAGGPPTPAITEDGMQPPASLAVAGSLSQPTKKSTRERKKPASQRAALEGGPSVVASSSSTAAKLHHFLQLRRYLRLRVFQNRNQLPCRLGILRREERVRRALLTSSLCKQQISVIGKSISRPKHAPLYDQCGECSSHGS